jgi:hypothetical protein
MKTIYRLNYLNYGDFIDCFMNRSITCSGYIPKRKLLEEVFHNDNKNNYVDTIISEYWTHKNKNINLAMFLYDFSITMKMKNVFTVLQARGFSYSFMINMSGFPYKLRKEINFRCALIANNELFYPPSVRRYINRTKQNHYFYYNAPAIAFALGEIKDNSIYVYIMQSDLVKNGPSCIREHFRGWRKILFHNILEYAKDRCIHNIYLCNESDVLTGCHQSFKKPNKIPSTWERIYSKTAYDFGLANVVLEKSVNIQLYSGQAPVYTKEMYYRNTFKTGIME